MSSISLCRQESFDPHRWGRRPCVVSIVFDRSCGRRCRQMWVNLLLFPAVAQSFPSPAVGSGPVLRAGDGTEQTNHTLSVNPSAASACASEMVLLWDAVRGSCDFSAAFSSSNCRTLSNEGKKIVIHREDVVCFRADQFRLQFLFVESRELWSFVASACVLSPAFITDLLLPTPFPRNNTLKQMQNSLSEIVSFLSYTVTYGVGEHQLVKGRTEFSARELWFSCLLLLASAIAIFESSLGNRLATFHFFH